MYFESFSGYIKVGRHCLAPHKKTTIKEKNNKNG